MFIPQPDLSKTRITLGGEQAAFTRQAPPKRHLHSGLRKPRTTGKASEVVFGIRTSFGDVMEQAPRNPTAQELRFALQDKEARKAELLDRTRKALANADLPDHW